MFEVGGNTPRATTLFNLQRNNVALQVAAICCSHYYILRKHGTLQQLPVAFKRGNTTVIKVAPYSLQLCDCDHVLLVQILE